MSFRRDSEEHRAWQSWIDRHRDTLINTRLPEFVYSDKMTWLRFLEHGGWHPEAGWSVRLLAPREAAVLCDFVAREYGREAYRYLVQNLEDVARHG